MPNFVPHLYKPGVAGSIPAPPTTLVAGGYRSELLSADRVRHLLGFGSRIRLDEFLMQHGIYDYSLQDYEADLLTLRRGRTKERKVR